MTKEKPLDHAIDILEENLSEIGTVGEWAEACGYDRKKKFSEHFLKKYGARPKRVHITVRMQRIFELFVEDRHMKCTAIAAEIGLSIGDGNLNNFLKSHEKVTPTEIRMEDAEVLEGRYKEKRQEVKKLKEKY